MSDVNVDGFLLILVSLRCFVPDFRIWVFLFDLCLRNFEQSVSSIVCSDRCERSFSFPLRVLREEEELVVLKMVSGTSPGKFMLYG